LCAMNVLMLNYEFPPIGGGGGQAHLNLLRQYAGRTDLKVDVLTCAPQPGPVMETPAPNVTIYKVGIRKKDLHLWRRTEVLAWLFKASQRVRHLIRWNRYDLAHAFFGFPTGWLCYRHARRLPYILSLRGSDVPGQHGRLQWDYKVLGPVIRAIWGKASGLVACSEGLRNRAQQFEPSAQIKVIPNGVDLERFHPAARQRAKGQAIRLLTVGRLSVTKRVDRLVDVVGALAKAGQPVQLTVAGGGALEADLRRLVTERGLDPVVRITGRVDADRIPDLYRQHDLYVSASMQEGMSNAMLEAMASGLPLVTTRCEGVDELIDENGAIVDEPSDLAEVIRGLALDPARLGDMAAASRRRAERFTWPAVADRYIETYKQVLAERSPDLNSQPTTHNSQP
jgi:glycosyltransferase involved in cell wall biosynthesis